MIASDSTTGKAITLALAFELAMHIFVHYTVPGASFAAGLAQFIAPALDGVGLTTVFSGAAAGGQAAAQVAALPSLGALAMG